MVKSCLDHSPAVDNTATRAPRGWGVRRASSTRSSSKFCRHGARASSYHGRKHCDCGLPTKYSSTACASLPCIGNGQLPYAACAAIALEVLLVSLTAVIAAIETCAGADALTLRRLLQLVSEARALHHAKWSDGYSRNLSKNSAPSVLWLGSPSTVTRIAKPLNTPSPIRSRP